MNFRHAFLTVLLFLLLIPIVNSQTKEPYHLYLDADFTTSKAAALAIEKGMNAALAEHDNVLNNIPFKLIIKDHRGNSRRSAKHLNQFIEDDRALVLFGGLHSSPLLVNRDFINNNKILTLVPWAAAGPITRSVNTENWVFRLSIDDNYAGQFIVKESLKQGFKRPILLLENTGWGRSNQKTMSNTLKAHHITPVDVHWFDWGINDSKARIILHSIIEAKADVIFFVGNAPEAITFSKQLSALSSDISVRSHWGITGGNFSTMINEKQRTAIDLQFIQTRFSFVSSLQTSFSQSIFQTLKDNSKIKSPEQLMAPTGFIHAYDLTKLLISAISQVKLTGNKSIDSLAIHHALEHLKKPVTGLIKTYKKPFAPYTNLQPDAHEALNINDYTMGYYDKNNTIHLYDEKLRSND